MTKFIIPQLARRVNEASIERMGEIAKGGLVNANCLSIVYRTLGEILVFPESSPLFLCGERSRMAYVLGGYAGSARMIGLWDFLKIDR